MPCRKITRYYCRRCKKNHQRWSKIGRAHFKYRIKLRKNYHNLETA